MRYHIWATSVRDFQRKMHTGAENIFIAIDEDSREQFEAYDAAAHACHYGYVDTLPYSIDGFLSVCHFRRWDFYIVR